MTMNERSSMQSSVNMTLIIEQIIINMRYSTEPKYRKYVEGKV